MVIPDKLFFSVAKELVLLFFVFGFGFNLLIICKLMSMCVFFNLRL